jgi:hypothetical protein
MQTSFKGSLMKFIHLQKSNSLINLAHVPRLDIVFERNAVLLRIVDTFKATICKDYPLERLTDEQAAPSRIEFYENAISEFLRQSNQDGVLTFSQDSLKVV